MTANIEGVSRGLEAAVETMTDTSVSLWPIVLVRVQGRAVAVRLERLGARSLETQGLASYLGRIVANVETGSRMVYETLGEPSDSSRGIFDALAALTTELAVDTANMSHIEDKADEVRTHLAAAHAAALDLDGLVAAEVAHANNASVVQQAALVDAVRQYIQSIGGSSSGGTQAL